MNNEYLLRLIHEADIPEDNVWMLAVNRLESGFEMLDRLVALAMRDARRAEREACVEDARTIGGKFSLEFESLVAERVL